ncbi:LLM class flavin-dependent oxidoreductase [Frondihabitans australicus]|uniref:Alkanesulfonate monooxygenase SsuD/methylene tetrahydromethanopterin reductase-like flavin-dependent oxidoreductase (Luciferase family) n=1 Tax=Frondihabitans australicus TaxID=386892 RepID=A0A495IFY8_9MICO|nr:LLM class flavin-dependent oxidoreductase [Frondihabitans australicus]RKR74251.1 alkanesulfonate monooxygenase SsuD/methylene tetrahydromethanopterin reductase-like flavin-dependent oxidoreductase (luciferase family) [Frondihabitans australicus]
MTTGRGPLELGFLSFVSNPYRGQGLPDDGAARALDDGIRLFQRAEEVGYDIGWIRVRHFEEFPSSPMTLLAAVSQRTSRIRMGTGVIPMRYEDPIRLAEDAATVDLLSGGRLELGLSTGIPEFAATFDPVFGETERSFADESQHRLGRLVSALRGDTVANSGAGYMSIPADTDLIVRPHSPGLADRVWYGAGSLRSAARTGSQGLDLHVSTLNTEETGDTFAAGQAKQLRAYREAFAEATAGSGREPRVAAGRIILPLMSTADEEAYAGFIAGYAERMHDDGRPHDENVKIRFDRVHAGSPSQIVDELLADEALDEVTELTLTLPANGGLDAHLRTIEAVAEHVAPALGWVPATASA